MFRIQLFQFVIIFHNLLYFCSSKFNQMSYKKHDKDLPTQNLELQCVFPNARFSVWSQTSKARCIQYICFHCVYIFFLSQVFCFCDTSLLKSAQLRQATAPACAHFERCCRHKNVCGKHKGAVFIINQLYRPPMEVISVKFMLTDLGILSCNIPLSFHEIGNGLDQFGSVQQQYIQDCSMKRMCFCWLI